MLKDRTAAGHLLAQQLSGLTLKNLILFAVPRGGIVVAHPLAQKLGCAIHVLVTRKIGHPANPEVAIGAVMPDGSAIWDARTTDSVGLDPITLERMAAEEYREVQRRQQLYSPSPPLPDLNDKTVLLVDDGIATGYTIRAAIRWLQQKQASGIWIAVPVAPADIVQALNKEAHRVICLVQPDRFWAVGMHYEDFSQTTDQEVAKILRAINLAAT